MNFMTLLENAFKRRNILLLFFFGLVFSSQTIQGQNVTINGTIEDASNNEPLPGVSILIEGTTEGVVTNQEGKFEISAAPGQVLLISYLGYLDEKVEVQKQATLEILLVQDLLDIEELVVIGYGTVKKKDLTTSVVSVDMEEMEKRPIGVAQNALQGVAAGVRVASSNGAPGNEPTVRVRGITSVNASNDPLYIIDGIPSTSLKSINPNDIETMQVLKDASSQAIYGARGAAGVIIVTTKSGAGGKPTIGFNYSGGINEVIKKIPVLSKEQYFEVHNEARENWGWLPYDPEDFPHETNWQDEVYQNGNFGNYFLTLSGGGEKNNYYVSLGVYNNEGIIKKSSFNRYSLKINADNTLSERVKIGTRVNLSRNTWSGIKHGDNKPTGVVGMAITYPPMLPVFNEDGSYYKWDETFYESPVAELNGTDQEGSGNDVLGSLFAEFKLIEGLKFKSTFTGEGNYWKEDRFLDPTVTTWGKENGGESYSKGNFRVGYIIDNVFTYNHTFKQIHNVNAVLVHTVQASRLEDLSGTATGYERNNVKFLSAGTTPLATESYAEEESRVSYIARGSYNYADKYLVSASYRAEGSSRFGPKYRYGYFPAVSAGWRLSRESFFENVNVIYDFKLRASYGVTGKEPTDIYPWQPTYGTGYNYPINDNIRPGYFVGDGTALPNEGLRWEETTQFNLGMDLSLFRGRVSLIVDLYNKSTTDLLFRVPVPSSTGYEVAWQNLPGRIDNSGLEFVVTTWNFDNIFKWKTDFNLTLPENKITSLDGMNPIPTGLEHENMGNHTSIIQEGESFGAFYGYVTEGVDPETGAMLFKDLNNDEKILAGDDRKVIGSPQPKLFGGMANTFSFKGISLYILIEGSYGNQIFNASKYNLHSAFDVLNLSTDVLDRWQEPGDETDVPKLTTFDPDKNFRVSDYYVEDGSYLRFKNITLSYSLKKDWFQKIKVKEFEVYTSLENYLTFTNYSGADPEVSWGGDNATMMGIDFFNYPQTKTIIFGFNVKF